MEASAGVTSVDSVAWLSGSSGHKGVPSPGHTGLWTSGLTAPSTRLCQLWASRGLHGSSGSVPNVPIPASTCSLPQTLASPTCGHHARCKLGKKAKEILFLSCWSSLWSTRRLMPCKSTHGRGWQKRGQQGKCPGREQIWQACVADRQSIQKVETTHIHQRVNAERCGPFTQRILPSCKKV